jgi:TolB-like protein
MDEHPEAGIVLFGGFRFDRGRGLLGRQNEDGNLVPVAIGSRALDILSLLIDRHGQVVSRDEILNTVWPGVVESANVTVQISALRRVIDEGRSDGSLIQTVSGRGYRFVATVAPSVAEVPSAPSPIDGGTQKPFTFSNQPLLLPDETSIAVLPFANMTGDSEQDYFADGLVEEITLPAEAPRLRKRRSWRPVTATVTAAILLMTGLAGWTLHDRLGWELPWTGAAPRPLEVASLATSARLTGHPLIAVLPFKNLSGDASQDFFSDGITEDVITALGRFSNLLVLAKSASFPFKGSNASPAEIGRLLDARYLLEGSVRRAGDRVRVTAELTEASTGRHVWSETYDADTKNIFGVQDDISHRVVGAAAAKLKRFERDRVLAKPTKNLAAYEYVLRGREFTSHSARESNDEAQDMFQRAIDLDPSYAAAYAELGLSLREAVASGWTEFVADDLGRAEALAQKALSLDPWSTTAYRLLAEIDLARGRFDLALGQTEHVLEINPSDSESFTTRGNILLWSGRAAEALPWFEGALRFDRSNARTAHLLGIAYYFLARYGEALEATDRGLAGSLGRNLQLMGRTILAATYAQLGRHQDADRERALVMRMAPFLNAERFTVQFGT